MGVMKLKIDFKSQLIRIGGEDRNYFHYYFNDYAQFIDQYSRIIFKLRKQFAIGDFNYADLIAYTLFPDDPYFQEAPGFVIIFNFIDLLDSLPQTKELEVEIDDFSPGAFSKCLKLVSAKKGWKTNITKESYPKNKLGFLFKNYFIVRNALKTRLVIRYAVGKARKLLGKHNRTKADVLCLSNMMYTRGDSAQNLIFGQLVSQLEQSKIPNKIVGYDAIDKMVSMSLFKRLLSTRDSYIGDYYSLKHFADCAREYKLLKQRFEQLKDKQEFKDIFAYRGYNFYEIIKPRLELLFNSLSYIACDNRIITKSIIKAESFKVLCVEHEENTYAKGFMLNLRKSKEAKVVALSHEIISDETIHLHFKNKEVLSRDSLLWRPLPDKKLVWGEYAKEKLIEKCNYPESIIEVTGYPKFDSIFKTAYDKKAILEKIGLEEKRKKIFLAEQSNIDVVIPKFYLEVAYKNPQIDFIFKPHPSENMTDVYKKFAKKPSNLTILDKGFNMYDLLHVSDYLVVRATTAGFEAMLMGKIVFVFNPRKEHLTGLPYAQSGAAIEISSSEELAEELRKLQDPAYRTGLLKKARLFAGKVHYKNDGRASERVANEIKKLIYNRLHRKGIAFFSKKIA